MSAHLVPGSADPVGRTDRPLWIEFDGRRIDGIEGQTVAGVLLGAGVLSWRRTTSGAPRGVFCGIGACFDCLVTVDGQPDVRACRRRATPGAIVIPQDRS